MVSVCQRAQPDAPLGTGLNADGMNKLQINKDRHCHLVAGFIRSNETKYLLLIPDSITLVIAAYFRCVYAVFFVDRFGSKLIMENVEMMATVGFSTHFVDINGSHFVKGINDCNQLGFTEAKIRRTRRVNRLTLNESFAD